MTVSLLFAPPYLITTISQVVWSDSCTETGRDGTVDRTSKKRGQLSSSWRPPCLHVPNMPLLTRDKEAGTAGDSDLLAYIYTNLISIHSCRMVSSSRRTCELSTSSLLAFRDPAVREPLQIMSKLQAMELDRYDCQAVRCSIISIIHLIGYIICSNSLNSLAETLRGRPLRHWPTIRAAVFQSSPLMHYYIGPRLLSRGVAC